MALWAYRAVDAEGKVSSGNMDAVNAIDLELRLKRLGLDLLTFESARKSVAARTRRVSREELITFCFHLSQLLKAGVNIIEALTDLRDSMENPGFKQVVASLLEDIEGGQKLSEAMGNHAYVFDGVFVSLVRAGEQSGQLNEVLDELSENLKWQDEISGQAKKSTGVVLIERPDKISFRYDAPNKNRIVSDGTTLKVYIAEDNQMIEKPVEKSQYPGAFGFLMGNGISSSFTFTINDKATYKDCLLYTSDAADE